MRALLDTVMQALPQVQCDSVQSPSSGRSPLSSPNLLQRGVFCSGFHVLLCFFPLSSYVSPYVASGKRQEGVAGGDGWWANSGVYFTRTQ